METRAEPVKCVNLFFHEFDRNWNISTNFGKAFLSNFMKIRSLFSRLMRADVKSGFNKRSPGTCEPTKCSRRRAGGGGAQLVVQSCDSK
jgi:hypothetical protein